MREKGKFSEILFPVCILNSYLFLKEQCIINVLFLDHPFAFVRVSYHVKHTKGGDGILKSASHYRPWRYRAVTPCQRRERGPANKLSSWPFSDVSRWWWEVAKKVLLRSVRAGKRDTNEKGKHDGRKQSLPLSLCWVYRSIYTMNFVLT